MSEEMLKPRSTDEALQILTEAIEVKTLEPQEISSHEASGRILWEDVFSTIKIPSMNRSIMDGYAIRSTDTRTASFENPVSLTVVYRLFPDSRPIGVKVSKGKAVYVATGAPIPEGADTVVKIEFVKVMGDLIEVRRPVAEGDNIAFKGEDISEGLILKKGQVLRPQDVGLLVGIGKRKVNVLSKLRIGILAVGDELTDFRSEDPNKKASNYSLIVSKLLDDLGVIPNIVGVAPDDVEEIKDLISNALEEVEMMITIAGISKGEKDLVSRAIEALEPGGLLVHGVKIRPGSVTGLGIVKGKPLIALPGHIASTLAAYYTFVVPIVSFLQGLGVNVPLPCVRVKMRRRVEKRSIQTFLFLRVRGDEEGLSAWPVPGRSSVLRRVVEANGFLFVPPQSEIEEGEEVDVTLFSRHELRRIHTKI